MLLAVFVVAYKKRTIPIRTGSRCNGYNFSYRNYTTNVDDESYPPKGILVSSQALISTLGKASRPIIFYPYTHAGVLIFSIYLSSWPGTWAYISTTIASAGPGAIFGDRF